MARKRKVNLVQSVWELQWRERIEAWRRSGQTQQEFCRAHGLSVGSFSHWKAELVRREGPQNCPDLYGVIATGIALLRCGSVFNFGIEGLGPSQVVVSRVVEDVVVGIALICIEELRLSMAFVFQEYQYLVGTALICIEGLRR